MDRYRDFDAARAEQTGEPLKFRLAGLDFETLTEIPAGVILDLASYADKPMDAEAFVIFGRFLRSIVIPEQRYAMNTALDSVSLSVMFEVAQWILGEITGRPLPSASSSPNGSESTGEPSNLAWLSPAEEARST